MSDYRKFNSSEEEKLRSYGLIPDDVKEYHKKYSPDDIKEFVEAEIKADQANKFADLYSSKITTQHIIEAIKKKQRPEELSKSIKAQLEYEKDYADEK